MKKNPIINDNDELINPSLRRKIFQSKYTEFQKNMLYHDINGQPQIEMSYRKNTQDYPNFYKNINANANFEEETLDQ